MFAPARVPVDLRVLRRDDSESISGQQGASQLKADGREAGGTQEA